MFSILAGSEDKSFSRLLPHHKHNVSGIQGLIVVVVDDDNDGFDLSQGKGK